MTGMVDAWRAGYAKIAAEAIESVDPPLEDLDGLCVPDCAGLTDPRCHCEHNVAAPGDW